MTRSMTAFTRQETQGEWGSLVWEIRSVNHRYLEPHLRLPDSLRELEGPLREKLRQALSRGKVECTLRFVPETQQQTLSVDRQYAAQLVAVAEELGTLVSNPQPINPLEVLRWPGVLLESELDMDAVKKAALTLFNQALADLAQGRQREGAELASLIEQRLLNIEKVVLQVRGRLPEILATQRNNLRNRLAELQAELDETRVEQEIALLAQKADVDEELDRLDTHVQEVRRVLKQKEPVGRRLDFLMQELNREANTLSSKSIVADTTQCAVELKVLIEQMREQIQNIE
ncbi:YicC/YloC family endoribonuclease [Marinobacterium rhizophilum]|uniref:YicC family protein n=1 Tax=Marinobacterium rhizophilum TaxID=420402 RepID=A0ABY5HH53_9GAMM|nr:YicC/YloC family endoribonuclease [Marinobacterium rhizophilum]UTW10938.1 YicC family protein [Marinobacterium rhizophilum]